MQLIHLEKIIFMWNRNWPNGIEWNWQNGIGKHTHSSYCWGWQLARKTNHTNTGMSCLDLNTQTGGCSAVFWSLSYWITQTQIYIERNGMVSIVILDKNYKNINHEENIYKKHTCLPAITELWLLTQAPIWLRRGREWK